MSKDCFYGVGGRGGLVVVCVIYLLSAGVLIQLARWGVNLVAVYFG